jgi:hypothetical protein
LDIRGAAVLLLGVYETVTLSYSSAKAAMDDTVMHNYSFLDDIMFILTAA